MEELYTERKALKDHIKWIQEERRKLSDDYWKSVERLRELDHMQGQSMLGQSEVINKLIDVINQQDETVMNLKSLIPNIPLEVIVEKLQHTEVTTVTQSKITTREIEEEKIKDERQAPVRRRKKLDLKSLSVEVAGFLKSRSEMEVTVKEIIDYLESKSIKLSNPSNTLNKMMGHNERIERAGYGLYRYKE